MRARIESCSGNPVREIVLTASADFRFCAGQYLEIALPGDLSIPLSIASAPYRLPELHLHYRSTPHLAQAQLLDALLEDGQELTISGPYGAICLETPLAQPLLIVAGGTGGAQAMGLLDALLRDPPSAPVTLLWCADHERDLYRSKWLQSLRVAWLSCECIVDPRRSAANLALQWLQSHAEEWGQHRIILSGSAGFVHTAAATLVTAGVDQRQLASDMLSC